MSKELELSDYPALRFLLIASVECLVFSIMALVFAIILLLSALVILSITVLAIGLALGAGGIWLFRVRRRRRGNRRARITHPLQVTVTDDGVTWEDRDDSGTIHTEELSWRQVEAFCMVEFQRDAWEGPYRVYLLWSGMSRLTWEWTRRMPVEQRVACDLLVRLAATQTGQPLYDLSPGVRALAAPLLETQSLNQLRADQALTFSLPPSVAIPLEELGRWSRRLLRLFLGAYALVALWGGLVITGSIFGLLAALLVIVAIVVFWRRRRSAAT
jgi:hypothetical protein